MTWQPGEPDVFWGELSPCEHLVQIYERDEVFLDALEGFVAGGVRSGEAVIVIATDSHRQAWKVASSVAGSTSDSLRRRITT